MSHFVIEGGKKLGGEIHIAGNKNAALPIIAATVLTDDECILENVPDITDVRAMFDILENLGKKVQKVAANTYSVQGAVTHSNPDRKLMQKLRASILFMGALLSRSGEAYIAPPGGCVIGRRGLGPHFEAFQDLGVEITDTDNLFYTRKALKNNKSTFLIEASVTATENTLLLAAGLKDEITIENTASEPHVADFCEVLQKMGVKISGVQSNRLTVTGKEKLHGFRHKISPDYIEMGTFTILAASTGSKIVVNDVRRESLRMTEHYFKQMGISLNYGQDGHSLTIEHSGIKAPGSKIQVGLWPGFPTDLMSPMIVLATQATGTTLCHDWMFESRMFFVDKLISMGAQITLCDPHRVLVSGPTQLRGQNLSSPDIRAGIALVIAALTARGQSVIANAELVDRGYEDILGRLQNLGASINRIV